MVLRRRAKLILASRVGRRYRRGRRRQGWARWFTIVVVSLNFFAQLGFLGNSRYPLWALTALALNVVVLYALTARWSESKAELTPMQ